MNVIEVRESLKSHLDSRLTGARFKFRKTDFEYRKKAKDIVYIYRIYVHAMTGWFNVQTSVFVGCPTINKEFNRILSRNIGAQDSTIGFGVWNEFKERGNYPVEQRSDIPPVANSLLLDFEECAIPYFDRIKSIEDVEKELNRKSDDGVYRPGSVSLACKGLIAADTVGRDDLSELSEAYYSFQSRAQNPKLAEPIREVFRNIENKRNANQSVDTTPVSAPR